MNDDSIKHERPIPAGSPEAKRLGRLEWRAWREQTKGFSIPAMMSQEAQLAMEDIVDVADACRAYFEHAKVPYDGVDVVAMAKLVLAREREIADGIKREKWEKAHNMGDAP